MRYTRLRVQRNRGGRTIFLCMALLIVVTLGKITSAYTPRTINVSLNKNQSYSEEASRQNFIKSLGWEVPQAPIEASAVLIPREFNEVYTRYNILQNDQGYELKKYRGKKVFRYTYTILNYPDVDAQVRLNLLVHKDKIIGGDVCSLALDGFMMGLKKQ